MREMLLKQLEREEKYTSIGISADGSSQWPMEIPWQHMADAFNMKTPRIFLTADEIYEPEVLEKLKEHVVVGCYIFVPLEDYSFLNELPDLWDVHIEHAENLKDISFLEHCPECFMVHIEEAHIPSFDPMFSQKPSKRMPAMCLCLVDCKVDNNDALYGEGVYFSEVVIINPNGTNDRERWEKVRAGEFVYYEYDPMTNAPVSN